MEDRIRRRDALGAAVALTSLMVPACASDPRAFTNVSGTMRVSPRIYASASSVGDLVGLIQNAEADALRVRMTGSGHSHSDVAVTSDVIISPKKLNRVLSLDRRRLKLEYQADPHLVRVESGITIRELNQALDQMGLALTNLGGYDAQTIVGAAITGTHGTGLAFGPIASQIVALELVTTGGRVLQIEPADGISDSAHFVKSVEEDAGLPLELVQDDDTFNAATVSLGCLGVVYAVTLRVVPKFWLREVRTLTTWNALRRSGGALERLLSGSKLRDAGPDPEHFDVLVAPYSHATPAGVDHTCVVTERFRMDCEPKLTADDRLRGGVPDALGGVLGLIIHLAGRPVTEIVNRHPELVPGLHEQAMQQMPDASYVNLSYKVFNLGALNEAVAFATELAFDLASTVAATERLFQIADELRRQGIVHTSPVSLRFVAPAAALIAPQYGRKTTMLEIPMLVGATSAKKLLLTYERAFIDEFAARPHWGLDLDVLESEAAVAALYPDSWPRFRAVYDRLNTRGTFDGRFTDRLHISRRPREANG